jgi:hypothetical protein
MQHHPGEKKPASAKANVPLCPPCPLWLKIVRIEYPLCPRFAPEALPIPATLL